MTTPHLSIPQVRPHSPIRAVILDWGGVMSNAGRAGQVGENLAALLGLPAEEGKRLVAGADHDLKRGLTDENDFWSRIEEATGRTVAPEQRDIWIPAAQLAPHPDMVAEVQALRAAGYLLGVLSNTHPAASDAVDSIGGYEGFDAVVASNRSASHSAKPDPAAYQEILDLLGVSARQALFVDDQDKSLRGAGEVGMVTLKAFPNSGAFPRDLRTALRAELARHNALKVAGHPPLPARTHGAGTPATGYDYLPRGVSLLRQRTQMHGRGRNSGSV